jgi:hypothetical protein
VTVVFGTLTPVVVVVFVPLEDGGVVATVTTVVGTLVPDVCTITLRASRLMPEGGILPLVTVTVAPALLKIPLMDVDGLF